MKNQNSRSFSRIMQSARADFYVALQKNKTLLPVQRFQLQEAVETAISRMENLLATILSSKRVDRLTRARTCISRQVIATTLNSSTANRLARG